MRALAIAAVVLAVPLDAGAQTSPAAPPPVTPQIIAPPPLVATPRDPLSLPGDNLPPSLAAMLSPPRPPGVRPPAAAANPAPTPNPAPSLEIAVAAAQGAVAACQRENLKVGVAVSDSAGVIITGMQMDGMTPGHVFNAARKNLVAIAFGRPTSQTREKLRAGDFATLASVRPNMSVFPGAVPLMSGGKIIGAIGASGASSDQDEACAAAGAAAVAGRL